MTEKTIKPLFTWRSAIVAENNLSPATRHILLTLSLHMNEIGESAFPSTKTLAKETGLSERSVCTHLQIAEDEGWLTKKIAGYNGQGWKRHIYYPYVPQGTERRSAPSVKGTEPDDKKALNLLPKALNVVQSNSSYNSSYNSTKDSSKPLANPAKAVEPESVEIWMPTNKNGHEYPILKTKTKEWEDTYPAVDVPQTLKEIRQWCLDNPSKRKTERGMHAFIGRWMAREQNGGRYG